MPSSALTSTPASLPFASLTALVALTDPSSFSASDPRAQLTALRRAAFAVASDLAGLSRTPAQGPLTDSLLAAAGALLAHPFAAAADNTETLPVSFPPKGWLGTLVQIFASPAWQTTALRPLADQPAWLWPTYARFLFAAPPFLRTTEHEQRWATHTLAHLAPLVRMLELAPGSASVKAVARIASSAADTWPVITDPSHQRQLHQGIARLRQALAPRLVSSSSSAHGSAPGCPLRVGIVHETSTPSSDSFAATRLAPLLDPERVELTPFALDALPSDIAAQVDALRAAHLDAVIFAGDLTRSGSVLAQLALHRLAPRQFASAHSPHTTGLSSIDVFLADASSSPEAYSEQLAVLPVALASDPSFDPSENETRPTRPDLGLPENAHLFAATVHPSHFSAATRAHWKTLLDADSSARVILLPGTSGPALDLLLADLDHTFGERLLLTGNAPLDPVAVAAVLRVSNTYLPTGAPHDFSARTLLPAAQRSDGLAFAEALTAILETACHSPGEPLLTPPVDHDLATRHAEGNHLLAFGRPARAVIYLLAAIDNPEAGPDVWHDLGLALHANGQPAEAIQALETCVRLAPDRLDSWLLLADWASDYGHVELAADIAEVVRNLAPSDPRVLALADRVAP